jgi:hypothetical protein
MTRHRLEKFILNTLLDHERSFRRVKVRSLNSSKARANWDIAEVESDLPADRVEALLSEIVEPLKSTVQLIEAQLIDASYARELHPEYSS